MISVHWPDPAGSRGIAAPRHRADPSFVAAPCPAGWAAYHHGMIHPFRYALPLLALAPMALVQACGGDTEADEHTLSLLSYNVAGLPAGLSGSEPDINTPQISPLLNDYDLVLVQEDWLAPDPNPFAGIFDVYHALLAADAEHPYQSEPADLPFGSNPDRPEAQLSDGLNRFSRSAFEDHTRVAWEGCFGGIDGNDGGASDCLATKGFSTAVHTLAPEVQVHVYDLHGEAGATAEDQQLSADDFEQLAQYIEDHSADAPILLAGDTNLHTGDGHPDGMGDADQMIWDGFLARTGLTDACEVLPDCADGIDKMAYRDSDAVGFTLLSSTFERETFTRPDDGEPLSDHPPLHVELRWSRH